MSSISLQIRYRPVRIGWCVESGQGEQLRRALRLTHAFAGGRFNPVIPVDSSELAESLIDRFQVDLLFAVAETDRIKDFVKSHDYLLWPDFGQTLFYERWQHTPPHAAFIDVYHAARHLREVRGRKRKALLVECADGDPLATVILATVGAYPTASDAVPDYEKLLTRLLGVERVALGLEDPLPPAVQTKVTPSRLTAVDLEVHQSLPDHGVYVGDCGNFDDIVNFWNLRAAGSGLIFYDLRHAGRLNDLLESHKQWLASVPAKPWQEGGAITVYGRDIREGPDLSAIGDRVIRRSIDVVNWNGLNIKPALRYWEERSALASVDESGPRPSATFALPEKPVYDDPELSQQFIGVSVRGSDPWYKASDSTFFPPYVPELNEYYGRELYHHYAQVRAEPPDIWRGVSLIVHSSQADMTLRTLPSSELAVKMFDRFGMVAKPSQAGLVTSRLIAQMGGVQDCRVFKIEGVRTLISKYSPDRSFTRSNANQTIANFDPVTNRPRFEPFEDLFIAPRPHQQKLTPQDVLDFLLQRGVFRVGLELTCPHCELAFWHSIDELKTNVECLYCGRRFNITDQLRDRDWAYRRSGLFGRDDHQHGGVPVAVTLQQLDTTLSETMLYTTSLELTAGNAAIQPCETDFIVIATGHSHNSPHQPQVAIGECKSAGGKISAADAEHLAHVADAFPHRRLNVFVLFAKTGTFSEDEVAACALAQHEWYSRVILLSKDELEPYHIYERHPRQQPRLRASDLEEMAHITTHLYPALRPKGFEELHRRQEHRKTARRAYELFEERGREHGRDWEDWFRAETELRTEQ